MPSMGSPSLRTRYENKETNFGIRDPALDALPQHPAATAYLLGWFYELSGCRQSYGFGPAPFTFAEIRAWAELKRIRVAPWEVDCIKSLDRLWLKIWNEFNAPE